MSAPTSTGYARSGDLHIAYQVVGDGPVDLLVAPGFISHRDLNWTMPAYVDFVERLASFSRVILFDKRGTGLSDAGADGASFEARMSDIGIVLDAVDSERAVLFSYSEGGPLACLFAATHTDRVQSLILDGTFPSGQCIPEAMVQRLDDAIDHWGEGRTAGIFSPDSDGPMVRKYTGLFERAATSPGTARALLRSVLGCDVTPILSQLHVPTTVIHRRDDPFALVEWGRAMADAVPGARFVEIDGRDHLPWMGDSTAVTDAIELHVTGSVAEASRTRTLATVLFTDIVDSTQTLTSMGDERWADTIQRHNDICREIFGEMDAWAVKSGGDGFMACLSTPEMGVVCAHRIMAAMSELGLRLRAGLHTGDLERVDVDDIAGMTVNIAARISSLAAADQLLASKLTSDLLVGSRHTIRPFGLHDLKGVPSPVEIVTIGVSTAPLPPADATIRSGGGDRAALRLARSTPGFVRALLRLGGG
ncbi:MAG: adenylate/guanylate cyclase domain-containing protein [Ilumatobacteraceae bacterium]